MMVMTEPDHVPACLLCHRHRDRWGICDGCIARVDGQLAEILDLHALAGTVAALEPGRTGEPGPINGAHRAPPLPLSLDALDLAVGEWLLAADHDEAGRRIWAGLESWEREWREHFALTRYGQASAARMAPERARTGQGATEGANPITSTNPSLTGSVRFLRAWWPRAADEHPAADEFAADVRTMHSRALGALRLHPARPWTVPCPADLGDGDCGYRLAVQFEGRELLLRCPRCGSEWDKARLLLVAAAAGRGVWVSIAEAAQHAGVHQATVYRAVAAGAVVSKRSRVDLLTVHEWAMTRRGAV